MLASGKRTSKAQKQPQAVLLWSFCSFAANADLEENAMNAMIDRPADDEYGAFYAGYIRRVPDGDIFAALAAQIERVQHFFDGLSKETALYRPAPTEWSVKEVLGHIVDTERILAYRTLCIARGEQQSLPGFEQDDYVRATNFDACPLNELLQEFTLLRQANVLAFQRFTPEESQRRGVANNTGLSVRALLYIMVGHVEHHLASLQTEYNLQWVG
jgi:uncharacterized damage-inducible protein DinB